MGSFKRHCCEQFWLLGVVDSIVVLVVKADVGCIICMTVYHPTDTRNVDWGTDTTYGQPYLYQLRF